MKQHQQTSDIILADRGISPRRISRFQDDAGKREILPLGRADIEKNPSGVRHPDHGFQLSVIAERKPDILFHTNLLEFKKHGGGMHIFTGNRHTQQIYFCRIMKITQIPVLHKKPAHLNLNRRRGTFRFPQNPVDGRKRNLACRRNFIHCKNFFSRLQKHHQLPVRYYNQIIPAVNPHFS